MNGETHMYHLHTFSCTYFYSHPREGGDIEDSNFVERQYISIHAPAKGATLPLMDRISVPIFLFTPPRRGRPLIRYVLTIGNTFLFTPPRRGRQHTFIIFISICVQLLSIMHNAISLLFIFRT